MYIHMFIQLFKFWHWGPVHTEPEDFKNAVFTPKTHQFFPSTLRQRNLKTNMHSPVIFKLSLRKIQSRILHDYMTPSISKRLCVKNVSRPHKDERFRKSPISLNNITTLTVLCLRLYEVATHLLLCFLLSVFNNNSCYIYSLTSQIPRIKSWVIRFWTYHSVHKFYGTLHSKDVRSSCQLPSPLCMPSRPLGPDRLKIKPPP